MVRGARGSRGTRPSEDTAVRPATEGQLPADPAEEGHPVPGAVEAEQNAASLHREAEGLGPAGKSVCPPGPADVGGAGRLRPPRAPATAGPGLQFRGPARDREVSARLSRGIWERGWMHAWDLVTGGCFVTCGGAGGAEKCVETDLAGRKRRRPALGPHGERLT